MKTSFDAVNNLFSIVAISGLMSGSKKVNGGLYKYQRPVNSTKEDIVINSLPMNREDVQEAVLNLNIFVPNLSITINGVVDNTQPNTARLSELCGIASVLLKDVFNDTYDIEVQQDNIFQDENNQHYVNLRIMFRNINV